MNELPQKKLISIVVPVFNEVGNVDRFCQSLAAVMGRLSDRYEYELVFTDNHSNDGTFEKLVSLAQGDERIRIIRFSKNFGYQRSIFTGYLHSKGDAAIQIDCDLQDPPELILEFVRKWEEGNKVVYGIRRSRKENWILNRIRNTFYRLINFLSQDDLPRDAGDFRLVDRCILDELKKIDDYQPYLRGTISTLGFNQIGILYDRAERLKGESKFLIRDLMGLAVDGILNHSILPLRIATFTGLSVSLITFTALIGYTAIKLWVGEKWPPGFATTTTLILLSLSLISLFLGIIGEYLGRIYQQVKKRPLTIIEREVDNPVKPNCAADGKNQIIFQ